MSPTKASYFLLLHLLLSCIPHNAQPVQFCGNTENYSSDSAFGTNLKTILSILTSNAVYSMYFPANIGNNKDTVFGLFKCRADVDHETCKKCVNKASQEITARCPNKTSTVWYDHCMLRYSDQRLYSEYEPAAIYSGNTQTVTEPHRFYQAVDGLIANLSMAALDAPMKKPMFAMGNVNFTSSQSIYGLVQCSPDLSRTHCTACLENARSWIQKCCYGKRERVAGTTSCMRFETYQFYNTLRADGAQEPPPGIAASSIYSQLIQCSCDHGHTSNWAHHDSDVGSTLFITCADPNNCILGSNHLPQAGKEENHSLLACCSLISSRTEFILVIISVAAALGVVILGSCICCYPALQCNPLNSLSYQSKSLSLICCNFLYFEELKYSK